MIAVAEALARVLALAGPLGTETVPLARAAGRVLAADVVATRAQPPFDASAMDGWALAGGPAGAGARYAVAGAARAGAGHGGALEPGQAARIFTGAPVPAGADRVAIQEEVTDAGGTIVLTAAVAAGAHVRPAGQDFAPGARIVAPRRLGPVDVALAAAMNAPMLTVHRRPVVAIVPTGDELVLPGEVPGPDQIVCSNSFAIAAMLEAEGAEVRLLPVACDAPAALGAVLGLAAGADLIVTIGGASVGSHDLVAPVAGEMGLEATFHKVAMRPGKPLLAGRLGAAALLGLPGNPVSSIVCTAVFAVPLVRRMLGLPEVSPERTAALGAPVAANGPRTHYMRARLVAGDRGAARLVPAARQDSALLSVLAASDALLIRPAGDGPRAAGEAARYLPLSAYGHAPAAQAGPDTPPL